VDAQKQYFLNPDGGPTHSFSPRLVRAGDEASGKGTPFCGTSFVCLGSQDQKRRTSRAATSQPAR